LRIRAATSARRTNARGEARPEALLPPGTLVVGETVEEVLDTEEELVLEAAFEEEDDPVDEDPVGVAVVLPVEVVPVDVTDELSGEVVEEAPLVELTAAVAPMTWNGPA